MTMDRKIKALKEEKQELLKTLLKANVSCCFGEENTAGERNTGSS